MTGAGFGGACVALTAEAEAGNVAENIARSGSFPSARVVVPIPAHGIR
jgi:galactokinase